jgi:hypothetical protein
MVAWGQGAAYRRPAPMPTRDFLRLFLPALAVVATLPTLFSPILAARAEAAPAVVDGRTIELPVPQGYCAIDRDRSPDAQAWEAMRGMQEPQNRLLAWFVVCDELERWRAAPRAFERHAIVLAPADLPPVRSRREWVAEVARGFEQSRGVVGEDAATRQLRERVPDLGSGPLSLQLLERNDDGVLATMVQQVDGTAGPRRVVSVITFTAVDQTRLSANFYGPDTGPEALRPVRDAATGYLAGLIAANPEPRFSWSFAWLGAALAGLAVLGGALYWLRRRRPAA